MAIESEHPAFPGEETTSSPIEVTATPLYTFGDYFSVRKRFETEAKSYLKRNPQIDEDWEAVSLAWEEMHFMPNCSRDELSSAWGDQWPQIEHLYEQFQPAVEKTIAEKKHNPIAGMYDALKAQYTLRSEAELSERKEHLLSIKGYDKEQQRKIIKQLAESGAWTLAFEIAAATAFTPTAIYLSANLPGAELEKSAVLASAAIATAAITKMAAIEFNVRQNKKALEDPNLDYSTNVFSTFLYHSLRDTDKRTLTKGQNASLYGIVAGSLIAGDLLFLGSVQLAPDQRDLLTLLYLSKTTPVIACNLIQGTGVTVTNLLKKMKDS